MERSSVPYWVLCLASGALSGPLMGESLSKFANGSTGGRDFACAVLVVCGLALGAYVAREFEGSYVTSSNPAGLVLLSVLLIPVGASIIAAFAIIALAFVVIGLAGFLYSLSGRDDWY